MVAGGHTNLVEQKHAVAFPQKDPLADLHSKTGAGSFSPALDAFLGHVYSSPVV